MGVVMAVKSYGPCYGRCYEECFVARKYTNMLFLFVSNSADMILLMMPILLLNHLILLLQIKMSIERQLICLKFVSTAAFLFDLIGKLWMLRSISLSLMIPKGCTSRST